MTTALEDAYDAIVVGASFAGLAVARELCRRIPTPTSSTRRPLTSDASCRRQRDSMRRSMGQPGGKAILLEDMRPGGRRLGTPFDRVDPIVSWRGPHINRRTLENIRAAGLGIERADNLFSDFVKLIVARRDDDEALARSD